MMLIRLQVPSKRRTSSPLFAYQLLSYDSLRDEIKRMKKDNYCRVYVFIPSACRSVEKEDTCFRQRGFLYYRL